MPTDQRLGTDDREDRQDRWKPAITVCEFDAPAQLAPQNDQLMSERGIFGLKPDLRLEWRGQDGENETEQPDHSTSLGDSITSSTRIRFSVHTGSRARRRGPAPAESCPACCGGNTTRKLRHRRTRATGTARIADNACSAIGTNAARQLMENIV